MIITVYRVQYVLIPLPENAIDTLDHHITVAKKNPISPSGNASGKKVAVLLSAPVKRLGVSHMRDFLKLMV